MNDNKMKRDKTPDIVAEVAEVATITTIIQYVVMEHEMTALESPNNSEEDQKGGRKYCYYLISCRGMERKISSNVSLFIL